VRRILLGITLVAGLLAVPAAPSSATWTSQNCYANDHEDSYVRRTDARAYATVARSEGYEYGGGCWNNDNADNTPDQPDSSGEGPDCSGLVFKSWELENSYGQNGVHWWDRMENVHGPYSSTAFHNAGDGSGLPFFHVGKSNSLYMDGFARDGHIGMLYSGVQNSNGTYNFIEAKGDDYGVQIFEESWMANTDYVGVRRKNWTADCYPNCSAAARSVIEVAKH
jgi:hypothetical protein